MSFRLTPNRWTTVVALLMAALIASLPATEAAAYGLTYDANGNLVTGDGKYRVYDAFNHLAKIYNGSDTGGTLLQEYIYHPTEDRILVKKTYNSTGSVIETVTYVSDTFVRVVNASGTYNTTYILASGQQVAQVLPDGSTQYLLTDIEGSVVVTTNSSGSVVERTTYTPYGDVVTGGTKTRFDYEGREADSITDDTDFRFRKYKPDWGLFLQPDDIIQNVYDSQSVNRYAFERNNPIRYSDADGHMILATDLAFRIAFAEKTVAPLPPERSLVPYQDAVSKMDQGHLARVARQDGFQDITQLPADQAITQLQRGGGWQRWGGLVRQIGENTWQTLRRDPLGHQGAEYPHWNFESFSTEGGRLTSLGDNVHIPNFGLTIISQLAGGDTAATPGSGSHNSGIGSMSTMQRGSLSSGSSYVTARGVHTTVERSGVTRSGVRYTISRPHASTYRP